MERNGWNIILCRADNVLIEFLDGRLELVKTDGLTGYEFVCDYLKALSTHYSNQLVASDQILQRMMGNNYGHLRKIKRLYESKLAVVSIHCAFGGLSNHPHCDISGNLNFSAPECPLRSICPFNGKNKKNKDGLYGCNPLYKTELNEKQLEIASILTETSLNIDKISDIIHLDEGRVRNIASEIYRIMKVKNRKELICLLKNKRIL